MSGQYLHGVEIKEMAQPPSINSIDSSIIGLIGTLEVTKKEKPEAEKSASKSNNQKDDNEKFYFEPYLVTSLDDFFTHFGENATGTLADALHDIYSQITTKVVVAPIKEKENIADGIKLLEKASEKLKVDPKILVAPELAVVGEEKNGIEGLLALTEKLKAVVLVDISAKENTLANITAATNTLPESDRLYLLYPQVIVKRKNTENQEVDVERPASAFIAGLMVKSDAERGYWYSPSNYKLSNISGLSTEIAFTFGDTTCLANQLNEKNINTIIWQGGYRLWGNKSYIKQGPDKNFEFLSVRRVADVLNMSLLKNHLWAIDQNITKNLKDTIVDSVNTFMRKLKLQGAIINGKCWPDPEKNTLESLAAGQFYVNFDFTAPYPAERITFQSFITKEYLTEVLS